MAKAPRSKPTKQEAPKGLFYSLTEHGEVVGVSKKKPTTKGLFELSRKLQ